MEAEMSSFCETIGKLRVVIAKGYISTYEVNGLEKGSKVFFYDRECGMPCSLYFNDRLISYCKIVVIDNGFAARIDNCTISHTTFSKPLLDDREIHNSELVLGTREISISDINKLATGSIIPFNTFCDFIYGKPMMGSFIVSGIEVARGFIGISDEKWSLEINNTKLSKDKKIPRRDSYISNSNSFKYYDFTRPDCVTRSNIKNFTKVHDFFGNYINGKVTEVDQMTWGELKEEFPNWNLILYKKKPLNRSNFVEATYYLPLDKGDKDSSIEEFARDLALKSSTSQIMEKVGVLYNSNNVFELFTSNFESTKELLEASWREISYLSFGTVSDPSPNDSEFIEDWCMIVTVKVSYFNNEFIIIYPLPYFEDILDKM